VLTSRTDLFVFSVQTSLLVTCHYLTVAVEKNINLHTMASWSDDTSFQMMAHSSSIVLHRLIFSYSAVVEEVVSGTPIEAAVGLEELCLSAMITFPQVVIHSPLERVVQRRKTAVIVSLRD